MTKKLVLIEGVLILATILHAIGGKYLFDEGYISSYYINNYYSVVTYGLLITGLVFGTYVSLRKRNEMKLQKQQTK